MPFTGNIGIPELLIVLAILLLIFGPKRLPGLGRQLGGGIREFRQSVTKRAGRDDDDDEDDAKRSPEIESGTRSAEAATAVDGEAVSERR